MYTLYKSDTKPTADKCVGSCYSEMHLNTCIKQALQNNSVPLDVYKVLYGPLVSVCYQYTVTPSDNSRGYKATVEGVS